MSASMRIYGHKLAGIRAYQLFEELANLYEKSGEVYIRRTLKSSKNGDKRKEYPPVYQVWYKPNFWSMIDRATANKLFEIGDKYGCRVSFMVEDHHAVALFDDGHQNFKGN